MEEIIKSSTPSSLRADKYRLAIVTMIDVLGFRKLVAGSDAAEIQKRLRAARQFGFPDSKLENLLEGRSFHFSDMIVRVVPLDSKANTEYPGGILFGELYDLIHAQMELTQYGVMLRGGMTIGEVAYDDLTFFGPGLIRAYELESEIAIFPRIVVDPRALALLEADPRLKKDLSTPAKESEFVYGCLRQDPTDRHWSVDYLRAESETNGLGSYLRMLQAHKRTIDDGLAKEAPGSQVAKKLLWLANYHNEVVAERQIKGEPTMWDDLLVNIPSSTMPSFPAK